MLGEVLPVQALSMADAKEEEGLAASLLPITAPIFIYAR